MLTRYPHNGKIIVTTESDSRNGIPTIISSEFVIEGRFEPASSKSSNIDYKAKYYCLNIDYLLRKFIEKGLFPEELITTVEKNDLIPFSVDGQTFDFNGKKFEIILFHNYQTHCEIWLE